MSVPYNTFNLIKRMSRRREEVRRAPAEPASEEDGRMATLKAPEKDGKAFGCPESGEEAKKAFFQAFKPLDVREETAREHERRELSARAPGSFEWKQYLHRIATQEERERIDSAQNELDSAPSGVTARQAGTVLSWSLFAGVLAFAAANDLAFAVEVVFAPVLIASLFVMSANSAVQRGRLAEKIRKACFEVAERVEGKKE